MQNQNALIKLGVSLQWFHSGFSVKSNLIL